MNIFEMIQGQNLKLCFLLMQRLHMTSLKRADA